MPKLENPFPGLTDETADYVHAKIPKEIFNYFFRHVLAGKDGTRQALVCIFFKELYGQCQSDGIKPEWDPENVERVAAVVGRLNFSDSNATRGTVNNQPVSGPERPVRTRRTPSRAAKSSKQPTDSDSNG